MQLYRCDISGTPIYFRNTTSLGAGDARVGFVTETLTLHTLKQMDDQLCSVPSREGELWRFCQNAEVYGSNWLVKADDPQTFALPARNNRSTPSFKTIERLERFLKIGLAQRHLFYSMLRFGLPCPGCNVNPQGGLVFDFLEDTFDDDGNVVPAMTAHEDGLIRLCAA